MRAKIISDTYVKGEHVKAGQTVDVDKETLIQLHQAGRVDGPLPKEISAPAKGKALAAQPA